MVQFFHGKGRYPIPARGSERPRHGSQIRKHLQRLLPWDRAPRWRALGSEYTPPSIRQHPSLQQRSEILQQSGLLRGCTLCLKSEDDDMSFRSKWKLLAQSSTLGMVRYTVKARRTIFYAADEALREMSNEVTPEHLLLGLLRADESIRAHLVMPTIESMRNELAANRPHERQSSLVLGRAARRVIIFAAQEREHLSHKHTGTEHLLLGIIRAGSHAAKVLQQHGITRDRVRRMLSNYKLVQCRSESFCLQSAR